MALVVAGALLTALGSSHAFLASAVIVAVLAGTIATYSATASMLLQSAAPGSLRGRAVALYGIVFYTLQPIGIVGLGLLADRFGVGTVLVGMSCATVLAVALIIAANRAIGPALLGRDIAGPESPPGALPAPVADGVPESAVSP